MTEEQLQFEQEVKTAKLEFLNILEQIKANENASFELKFEKTLSS